MLCDTPSKTWNYCFWVRFHCILCQLPLVFVIWSLLHKCNSFHFISLFFFLSVFLCLGWWLFHSNVIFHRFHLFHFNAFSPTLFILYFFAQWKQQNNFNVLCMLHNYLFRFCDLSSFLPLKQQHTLQHFCWLFCVKINYCFTSRIVFKFHVKIVSLGREPVFFRNHISLLCFALKFSIFFFFRLSAFPKLIWDLYLDHFIRDIDILSRYVI